MIYKIIFYALAGLFLIACGFVLAIFKRGGTTNLVPVQGVMVGVTTIDTDMYDETLDIHFTNHKVVVALLFIFIAFEWVSGDLPPDDTELKPESDGN